VRQLDRLGLGEAVVVGGVEVVVNGVGVGAVLNGNNKVVVGGGKVCDACVVAALWGGTEEIAKFCYGKLETCCRTSARSRRAIPECKRIFLTNVCL